MTKEEYLQLAYLLTVKNIADSDIAHLPMLVIVGNTLKGISELGYEVVKKPSNNTGDKILRKLGASEETIEKIKSNGME
jgi:hypothetical protein